MPSPRNHPLECRFAPSPERPIMKSKAPAFHLGNSGSAFRECPFRLLHTLFRSGSIEGRTFAEGGQCPEVRCHEGPPGHSC